MEFHITLDCCKDFLNLLTSKLNEIEEKESTPFQGKMLIQAVQSKTGIWKEKGSQRSRET